MLVTIAGRVTRERYDAFPAGGRPSSELIATTFRTWDAALSAAGLDPTGDSSPDV